MFMYLCTLYNVHTVVLHSAYRYQHIFESCNSSIKRAAHQKENLVFKAIVTNLTGLEFNAFTLTIYSSTVLLVYTVHMGILAFVTSLNT
jgi:hypothetical protein